MKGFHRERRTRTESISCGPIEGPGRCDIEIRWNAQARAFFVDYGNVRFSVTRLGAILLGDALREAEMNQSKPDGRGPYVKMREQLAEEENSYVAYLYFTHPISGEPVLHIGDSDTPGAFKVFRRRM